MTSHEIPEVGRLGRVETIQDGVSMVYTRGDHVYASSDAYAFRGRSYRVSVHVSLGDRAAMPNAPAMVEGAGKVAASRHDAVVADVVARVLTHASTYPGYPLAAEAARKAEEAASAANAAAAALEALRAAEEALQTARRDARRAAWALDKFRRDGASRS